MMRNRQRNLRQLILLLAVGLLLLALGSLALAQSGTPQIAWWTVDGGGGTSSGGIYAISGTAGQPEAGGFSSDGGYTVIGGFWGAASPPAAEGDVFLPVIRRP